LRLLSIDILLGVFSSYIFAAVLLESELHILVPMILCLAVWLVYTLDHLSDAYHLGSDALKPVYLWHWKRRRILLGFCAVLVLLAITLSFLYLSPAILLAGLAGTTLLLAYMLVHSLPFRKRRYFFKEFWVGGIYTLGIWGLPVLFRDTAVRPALVLIMASFFCLVMVNVLSYSYFELPLDREESLPTFAVRYGSRRCRIAIVGFLALAVILALSGLIVGGPGRDLQAGGILLLMSVLLAMIQLFPGYFGRNGRFGILADSVFLLPCLILLMHSLQVSF
jgi:hypothetical protein